MRSTLRTILNYRDQSDWVWSMMKTRKDKDMIDHKGAIYTKTKTKQS